MTFDVRPADWSSFETVKGEKGGCGGCWCMLWRLPKPEMDAGLGAGNRAAMKRIFDDGHVPGLIAFDEDRPVGWIQIDRREAFGRLEKSRILNLVDERPVWSISCFFIDKSYRRQGLSAELLAAAGDFVRKRGGDCLEGYPIDTPKPNYPPVYAWTGFVGAFRRAGFVEVARRSPTRPIMRKML